VLKHSGKSGTVSNAYCLSKILDANGSYVWFTVIENVCSCIKIYVKEVGDI